MTTRKTRVVTEETKLKISKSMKKLGLLVTHGQTGTPLYKRWKGMMRRCYTKSATSYPRYGARGITVCFEWHDFSNFFNDMSPTFKEDLQLNRINNSLGYSKENCNWVSAKENSSNKRNNVTYKGEIATDASIRLGGKKFLIFNRLTRGWSREKAFTQPVQQ